MILIKHREEFKDEILYDEKIEFIKNESQLKGMKKEPKNSRNAIELSYVPTEKQQLFHLSDADEVLYGGAAGGGKSMAITMEALLRAMETPGVNCYVFRRTYPELKDVIIPLARQNYPQSIGQFKNGGKDFKLINGSSIRFRHCFKDSDVYKYQGAEIHYLFIDELTHFPMFVYDYLKSRLRAPKELGIKPCVRATSNPGGLGHAWVKQYFIDRGQPFKKNTVRVYSSVLKEEKVKSIQYIPALVTDNPHMPKDYIFELEKKPKALKNALLYGLWTAFEGQAFMEFTDDSAHYKDGLLTHVIAPFDIPADWPRFRSFDFGYSRPFAVQWWAVSPDDIVYLYREWYGSKEGDNTGLKLTAREIASRIIEIETQAKEKPFGIADPSIWDASRGECIAEQMASLGVDFSPADNARLSGKMQMHFRLAFDEKGRPSMYVFYTCKNFIRTIAALTTDPYKVEDVDTKAEDHSYDAARYFLMARPIGKKITLKKKKTYDPLETQEAKSSGFLTY